MFIDSRSPELSILGRVEARVGRRGVRCGKRCSKDQGQKNSGARRKHARRSAIAGRASPRRDREFSTRSQFLSGKFLAPSWHQLRATPQPYRLGKSPGREACVSPWCSQQSLTNGWQAAQYHSSANIPPSARSDRSRETIPMSRAQASIPNPLQTDSAPSRSDFSR